METIFDHKVTLAELQEYESSFLTKAEYLKNITNSKDAYADIASLYANRGKGGLTEKYRKLCGFYDLLPQNFVFDECLPYKLS